MSLVSYVSASAVKSDIAAGRSLGLTPSQADSLANNFKGKVEAYKSSLSAPSAAVNTTGNDVFSPFANSTPLDAVVGDTPVSVSPAVTKETNVLSGGPSIVSEPVLTDFDEMQKKISEATKEYEAKVAAIVESYKKKINDTISLANDMKDKAHEHMENAKAAEQIANIAFENSQNNDLGLKKVI